MGDKRDEMGINVMKWGIDDPPSPSGPALSTPLSMYLPPIGTL